MAEVARLYYVRDLTQQDIATRLGVSRFKVLRMLEQARAEGVVRFEIDQPVPVDDGLSRALEERFELSRALVVDDLAGAAATLLPRLLRADDILGVAWGETLAAIERRLAPPGPGVPVVQVCGAIEGLIIAAERSIALSVAQLRRTRVVAVAGGRRKRAAVAGALRSGLVDTLVTDATCARAALA